MRETEYVYAVSYIKTLENKMLTKGEIEALISSEDLPSAIKFLTDRGYGKNSVNYTDADNILKDELEKNLNEAKNDCGDDAPIDIVLYKNDFQNLKTVTKAFVSGNEWENLILKPYTVEPQKIEFAVKNNNFEVLPSFIEDIAKKGYEIITKTGDGCEFEIFADKEGLLKIYELSKKQKNAFLREWAELEIIIADMKIAARCVGRKKEFIKKALIPIDKINTDKLAEAAMSGIGEVCEKISDMGYKKISEALSVSFAEFERCCDNEKIEFIRKAKANYFGFEAVMAFLIGKEYEIQNLRIILFGKQNKIDTSIIRERVRELYA